MDRTLRLILTMLALVAGLGTAPVQARTASAEKHDYGVLTGIRLQLFEETGVRLRARIGLPFDRNAASCLADKVPLRAGPYIYQFGIGRALQEFISLCRQ